MQLPGTEGARRNRQGGGPLMKLLLSAYYTGVVFILLMGVLR